MRGVLRNLGVGRPAGNGALAPAAATEQASPLAASDPNQRLAMLDAIEEDGIAWFWATNSANELIYLSGAAARLLGSTADVVGRPLGSLMQPEEGGDGGSQRSLSFLLGARQRIADITVRVETGSGPVWWSINGRPHFSEGEREFLGYRGSAKDISELFEKQRDASRMAEFDELTGLANRHRLGKRLAANLMACKAERRSCALLSVDLDRFKHVNDTLGHPAGDELLRQVSQRMRALLPDNGEIGRVGGDEFQITLLDVDDRGQLGELAQRLIQILSQPYQLDGNRAVIGASAGIAIAPYDGIETEELSKAADLALYAAKGSGRGQYRFYSNDLMDSAQERKQLAEDLHDALERGEFELHYQPVVGAGDSRLSGFEALLRWNHPERGQVSPAIFIPIAEDAKLMTGIGDWVLREACEEASSWPAGLNVSVNLSAQQFADPGLVASVSKALAATGLRAERLELEITERIFLGDDDALERTVTRLRRIGVKLVLDDFGTGHASLGCLRKAPIDRIKIDQSFVRGSATKDNANAAIIAAIVSLAGALGIETTAEGVEAMDELDLVRERGVTHVQGFVFSRPIPADEVRERLVTGDFHFEPKGPSHHRADRRTLFRRVGVIHEDHRYDVVLRNLSRTGARIDGLLDVPLGTQLVLDLGQGQLAIATVKRSQDATQGLEFETPLISDGADGLCTRYRISPYALAAAGMPLRALPRGEYPLLGIGDGQDTPGGARPRFLQVDYAAGAIRAA